MHKRIQIQVKIVKENNAPVMELVVLRSLEVRVHCGVSVRIRPGAPLLCGYRPIGRVNRFKPCKV